MLKGIVRHTHLVYYNYVIIYCISKLLVHRVPIKNSGDIEGSTRIEIVPRKHLQIGDTE